MKGITHAVGVAVLGSILLHGAYQIKYSDFIIRYTGGPSLRGHFNTLEECERARRSSASASGDYTNLMNHSSCVGSGSSGDSYGGSYGGGYSKDAWKYQLMQGFVSGMMQGFMQGLENQQRQEAQRAEQLRQQQEEVRLQAELQRKKTEAEKRAAKAAWEKKRKDEAVAEKWRREEEARKAAEFRVKMGIASGGLELAPMGGTPFFGSGSQGAVALAFKPIGKIEHDASSLSALDRAVCSSQLMNKANRSGNNEEARYYSDQAERVMSGGKYNEACDLSEGLPDVPKAPVPEPLWSPEEMAFFKKVEEVSVQMQEKALQIQEIEAKVVKNKEKIDDAKAKKEQADAILKDLQSKAASTDDPAKKAEIDTLLAEANALLSEAENDSLTAQQENEQLLNDKQKIEQSMQETKKMLEAQIPKPNTAKGAENEKR